MNHPTILDAAYLLMLIPNGTCIYKRSIGANPFYGCIARLAGFLPNEGGPDMVRAATERLAAGEQLIVFPEGTRSTAMQTDSFKSGFALIAKRAKVPIRLLWLNSSPGYLTREASPWRPTLPASLELRQIGVVEPTDGESAAQLRDRVASVYRERIKEVA